MVKLNLLRILTINFIIVKASQRYGCDKPHEDAFLVGEVADVCDESFMLKIWGINIDSIEQLLNLYTKIIIINERISFCDYRDQITTDIDKSIIIYDAYLG